MKSADNFNGKICLIYYNNLINYNEWTSYMIEMQ